MNPRRCLRSSCWLILLWLSGVPGCSYDYDKFSSEKPGNGGHSNASGISGGSGASTTMASTILSGGSSEASGGTHASAPESSGGVTSSSLGGTSSDTASTSLGGSSGTGTATLSPGGATATSVTNVAGATATPCLPPRVECNGICTELSSDALNCGSCGRACSDSPAEWAVCLGGLCSCDKGITKCAPDRECVRNNRCQAE